MKTPTFWIPALGALAQVVFAADIEPFAPTPFSLEEKLPRAGAAASGISLPLPIGPVRIEYGLPIRGLEGKGSPLLDAPGIGYRAQKAKFR